LAVGNQCERGLGFIDFVLVEADGLVETIGSGGLEAGFLELLDDIGLGFAKTFAAGVATFERIVGEKLDVRPPGVAIEMGNGRILPRWRTGGKNQEKSR
jgi:hypothetical protein